MENKQIPEDREEKSILDQIITNHQAQEVGNLNIVEIIDNMFNELNERERDVLARRFGLHGSSKETLEKIGSVHSLTRERIRQIEAVAIKKLRQLKNLENYISGLKKVIYELLEEHGGFMEQEYLIDNLVKFSVDGAETKIKNEDMHKSHLDFLISKLLHKEFEQINNSHVFKGLFKLKFQALEHFEELAEELFNKTKEKESVLSTEEIFNLVYKLDSYMTYKEKLKTANNIDISPSLNTDDLYEENSDLINANKVIYSILRAARKIEQNRFGHWGANHWREIKPKTINDKIYLVLKNYGKPMHFATIADHINQIGFDSKKANSATVHNELILDNKYVLVGRGLYALKDWGYQQGTVAEVIENILAKLESPISRDGIINKVLEQRKVKRSTIILALMDKEKFDKLGGKYKLKVN